MKSYDQLTSDIMDKLPRDVYDKLDTSLKELEQALLNLDPQMPTHLRESHRLLISYPETVHLLDDAEVNQLITAAENYTKVSIIKEPAKKSGGRKKVDVNDL